MTYRMRDVLNAMFGSANCRIENEKITIWREDFAQPTEAEIQAKISELEAAEPMLLLRLQRDQLLSETDWWCVSDRTPTAEQLQYRQALRDLPASCTPALDEDGNLINVNWPTPPTE